MVRKGEIACRDGWSRDLWAPRSDAGTAGTENDEPRQQPLPPISPEEMSVLVDSGQVELGATTRSAAPVDVVVGEAPAMPPMDERATLLSHDPRAAIEAARKRHAAKSSAADSLAPTLNTDAADAGDTELDGEGRSPSGATIVWRPKPSRSPRSVPLPPPSTTATPAVAAPRDREHDHFSTVPERLVGVDLPRANAAKMAPPVAGAAQDIPDDPRRQSLERLRDRQSRLGIAPVTPLESSPPPRWRVDEDDPVHRPAEPRRSWRGSRDQETYPEPTVAQAEDFDWRDDVQPAYDMEAEAEYVESDVEAPGPDDDLAYALAGQYDDDLDIGDTSVHVAPDVPRMCKTCRDFRPADSGERGWCNNNWAFSHRRMVDADELPCESSLGCWWLPHDEVWLSTADVGTHSEPTPLVDLWLSRRDAAGRRRQGS